MRIIMFNLPVNDNTSTHIIYETAHIVRELIKKGHTSLAIHKETGMPLSAIDIMIAEYKEDTDVLEND